MKTKFFLMIGVSVAAILNTAFAYDSTGYVVNAIPATNSVSCSGTCTVSNDQYALEGYQGGQGQSLTLTVSNMQGSPICELQAQEMGRCMSTRFGTQCNYKLNATFNFNVGNQCKVNTKGSPTQYATLSV